MASKVLKATMARFFRLAASNRLMGALGYISGLALVAALAGPVAAETQILVSLGQRTLHVVDLDPQQFPPSLLSAKPILAAVKSTPSLLGSFPVAIGAPESPTPSGMFAVLQKIPNPSYFSHSKNITISPGPSDPLGTRWVEFLDANSKTFGIHGTAWPQWVHRQAAVSLGCVRMLNPDVEQVF
jgi:lipoprotein-anchoring transpeptidase ErfK/SrfK